MSLARSMISLLAACVALPACSHAPLSAPFTEERPVTIATSPAAPPTQTAAHALQRVLDLIQDSHALADLTPGRVGQVMGVSLERARDGSTRYGFGAALDPQWSYAIALDANTPDATRFEFSFNPATADASMTAICQMDYDAFTAKLEALGFSRTPYNAEHGRMIKEWFDRPGLRLSVYPQGEAAEVADHRCVRMVTMP